MGGSASKAGAAAGRALRVSTPKVNSASAGRTGVAGGGSSPLPHFPQDDAAVKNFKPTKGIPAKLPCQRHHTQCNQCKHLNISLPAF